MSDDLEKRLRALTRGEHSDHTIGNEAADAIARREREMKIPWPWDTSIIDKLDLDSYSKRVLRMWVFFDRLLWTSIGVSGAAYLALLLFWSAK